MIRLYYKFTLREKTLSGAFQWPQGHHYSESQKGGVNYRFKYTRQVVKRNILGKNFGDRLKEPLRAPFSIYQHGQSSWHCTNVDCFSNVGMEVYNITRLIKEAMFIWVNDPSLNTNLDKFQLPNIWCEVLQDTAAFQLGNATTATLHGPSTPHQVTGGKHNLNVGKFGPLPQRGYQLSWHQCLPPCHTKTGANYGKYSLVSITFSFGPDEAMFDLTWQNVTFVKANKDMHINNLFTMLLLYMYQQQIYPSNAPQAN